VSEERQRQLEFELVEARRNRRVDTHDLRDGAVEPLIIIPYRVPCNSPRKRALYMSYTGASIWPYY